MTHRTLCHMQSRKEERCLLTCLSKYACLVRLSTPEKFMASVRQCVQSEEDCQHLGGGNCIEPSPGPYSHVYKGSYQSGIPSAARTSAISEKEVLVGRMGRLGCCLTLSLESHLFRQSHSQVQSGESGERRRGGSRGTSS